MKGALFIDACHLGVMNCSQPFMMACVALAIAGCSTSEPPSNPDRANDDYHVTGNCAMAFTPEDLAKREAKHAEPGVTMVALSNGHEVFTQRFGESDAVKVLVLHGGPACTHEYMLNVAYQMPDHPTLSDLGNAEVHMYDQLGSFYSDQPTEDLWNIDRWVEEVEEVRVALGLDSDNFYLLGNSWGGILAMEYALVHQSNLKGLIVCNMQSSIPEYAAYNVSTLRPQMRPSLVDSLEAFEEAGDLQNPCTSTSLTQGVLPQARVPFGRVARRGRGVVFADELQAVRFDARTKRVQGWRPNHRLGHHPKAWRNLRANVDGGRHT